MFSSKDPYKKRLYITTYLINRILGDYRASKIYKALTLYQKLEDENYEIDMGRDEYPQLVKLLGKIKTKNLEIVLDAFLKLFDQYWEESKYHVENMGDKERASLIRSLYSARYIFKIYSLKKSLEGKEDKEKIERYRKEINERREKLKDMKIIQ